jgi:hypothetical protein
MRYEVWEYEHGCTYALCVAGDEGERTRADRDDGWCVLLIEVDTWEEAKQKQNDYVSGIRRELMEKGRL